MNILVKYPPLIKRGNQGNSRAKIRTSGDD